MNLDDLGILLIVEISLHLRLNDSFIARDNLLMYDLLSASLALQLIGRLRHAGESLALHCHLVYSWTIWYLIYNNDVLSIALIRYDVRMLLLLLLSGRLIDLDPLSRLIRDVGDHIVKLRTRWLILL